LLGPDAGGLSASSIARLKEAWSDEHARWSKRDLSAKRYVYFWVDGIHVQARLEADAQCLLVIIGATPEGKKEVVGLTDGVRESVQSWRELLLDLRRRGLSFGDTSRPASRLWRTHYRRSSAGIENGMLPVGGRAVDQSLRIDCCDAIAPPSVRTSARGR
jgi:hypothetical protein